LKSNVIKTASEDDSTQDVSHGSNQAARCQSRVTWASNVAETQSDRPQSTLAKPDQAQSNITSNIQTTQSATPAFPTNLINIIGDILGQPSPAPMTQEFDFELTKEAAAKNFCVLKKYGLDLSRAIDAQKSSPLFFFFFIYNVLLRYALLTIVRIPRLCCRQRIPSASPTGHPCAVPTMDASPEEEER
jgi:hypothetical protein